MPVAFINEVWAQGPGIGGQKSDEVKGKKLSRFGNYENQTNKILEITSEIGKMLNGLPRSIEKRT